MTIDIVLDFGAEWAIYVNIGVLCLVCVIYTLLGGMKAVIWTDVVQVGKVEHLENLKFFEIGHCHGADNFLHFWQNGLRFGPVDNY